MKSFFYDLSPTIVIVVAILTGAARVYGFTSPAYQAVAHGVVASLFTLGVCRSWAGNGRLYLWLGFGLTLVELLAHFKVV